MPVPQEIIDRITKKATLDWPDDYSVRLHVIRSEIEAYSEIVDSGFTGNQPHNSQSKPDLTLNLAVKVIEQTNCPTDTVHAVPVNEPKPSGCRGCLIAMLIAVIGISGIFFAALIARSTASIPTPAPTVQTRPTTEYEYNPFTIEGLRTR